MNGVGQRQRLVPGLNRQMIGTWKMASHDGGTEAGSYENSRRARSEDCLMGCSFAPSFDSAHGEASVAGSGGEAATAVLADVLYEKSLGSAMASHPTLYAVLLPLHSRSLPAARAPRSRTRA